MTLVMTMPQPKRKPVDLNRKWVKCSVCEGTGVEELPHSTVTCPECNGERGYYTYDE